MFGQNEAFGSNEVNRTSTTITIGREQAHGYAAIIPIRRASPDRLAELVHHLGDVPVSDARRVIRRTGKTCDEHDPLTIVAGALLQLRREAERCTPVRDCRPHGSDGCSTLSG